MATGDIYRAQHARSLKDPEGFWAEQAEAIDWSRRWDRVLESSNPPFYRWFEGGELNACHNALDRHVEGGRAEQVALIYDSPVTGTKKSFTYRELRDRVAAIAGMIAAQGVGKGDRVIIYMPMIPEAVMAMLACARLGAVHSVVFGGFAAKELATRINDAKPRLVISASCGIEPGRVVQYKPLLDEAINLATTKPEACIILQRPRQTCDLIAGRDFDWAELRAKAIAEKKTAECVPVLATDPLYILYTSGTTGVPKGVVRDNGGHLVALNWSMYNLYGVKPGEVWWCGSDIGWVVGHSYIIYGPLFHGNTSVMYEGKPVGTPDAGAFWRVIAQHKVAAFFTAPTAFRAIKKDDPNGEFIRKYDLSNFRTLFLAGERADPPTVEWAEKQLNVPVIDHWWQTETGWAIVGNPVGIGVLPVKPGSATVPMPGYQVDIVDEAAKPVPAGTTGSIVVKLPLPPSCLPTLWQQEDRCREAYFSEFPGYYKTSDAGYKDDDGYVFVMGRTDDIINVAGHRLSTGGMEEILASHPDVAECAVLGIKDDLKGEIPCGFLVLKSGAARGASEVESEVVSMVRDKIGPVAAFKRAVIVPRLPKTRSGKILRGTMKKIADGEPWTMPATIEDPKALDDISAALQVKTPEKA